MFKFLVVFACIAAVAIAAPATDRDDERVVVKILNSNIKKETDGSYNLSYASDDGTSRQESATVVDAGTENQALEITGSYKYINDEDEEVEVFYTAGVNGFVPHGSIINKDITAVAEAAKDLPKEEPKVKKTRD